MQDNRTQSVQVTRDIACPCNLKSLPQHIWLTLLLLMSFDSQWTIISVTLLFPSRRFSQYIEVELNVSQHNCGEQNNIRYLEHVVVTLNARFSKRGYLEGFVTSPSGTTSQILPYRPNDVIASEFNDWPILSLHFWGENPQGNWRLRLQNHYPNYGFSGKNFLLPVIYHRGPIRFNVFSLVEWKGWSWTTVWRL